MKNINLLLYGDGETGQNTDAGTINDFYISDMGIEYIKNLEGFYNFETYRIFINTVSVPLTNPGKIIERQNILKDFLEFPGIAQKMKLICDEIQQNKCRSDETDPRNRLVDFKKILERSINVSEELLAQLKYRDFCSDSLKDLRRQLDCREKTESIISRINMFIEHVVSSNLTLSLEYGSAFKFKSANIYSGEIKKSENANANAKSEQSLLKFFHNKMPKRRELTDGFFYGDGYALQAQVEGEKGILAHVLPYATSVVTELNRHILSFCAELSKQLSFYIACIEIVKFMDNKQIKNVFPEICTDKSNNAGKKIQAKNLLDFGLLLPKNYGDEGSVSDKITANDFEDCENAVYLISGANQGGKTTFLKSVGIAQLFAQAGLKVPAEEYKCPVFNNFFSHFSKDEDEDLNFGKLAEELTRIKKAMPQIAGNALVLFNESFATTTESEGFEIASDILRALSEAEEPPKIFFVTHNYPLLKKRREVSKLLANGAEIKNLIVREGENPADRTYKIVEGEPQENINTMDFFEKLTKGE